MSRLHDVKTGKKKKHSCLVKIKIGEVLNQRSGKNQPHKRVW